MVPLATSKSEMKENECLLLQLTLIISNTDKFNYCTALSFIIIEILVLNTNTVVLDQTPRSAASDRGLHCLPTSILWTLGLNGLNI